MKSQIFNTVFNDKWVLTFKDVKLEHLEEEGKILYNNKFTRIFEGSMILLGKDNFDK